MQSDTEPLVAVDSSTPPGNDSLFLIGVAVEVDDKQKFRTWYHEFIRDFADQHGLDLPYPVLKSKTIVDRLASFDISKGIKALAEGIVQNPHISRLNVSIGWYADDVELGYSGETKSGISFVSGQLESYFEIVTLWRYHRSHEYEIPTRALVDEAQGRITKAWKYVGHEFDIDMIPHGDLTYPSVSTADILGYYLGRIMPNDAPFIEYDTPARTWLLKNRNQETEPYVTVDLVNERYTDHIVPDLPYTISREVHYPHPVVFLHDTVLSSDSNQILPQTDIHALARQWAAHRDGCVVGFHTDPLPRIVEDGDLIVYTKGTGSSEADTVQELHPTKELSVIDSTELADQVLGD